jgi:hypothetical protein
MGYVSKLAFKGRGGGAFANMYCTKVWRET